ncbi:PorT family protein [Flavobacterium sp. P7388]|uniref:PorT family protein n=2 Tax=Flavobacterium TaxID=237 RepID=A0A941B3Q7_9FLAO|nr:porin family protein [Flavobacterium sp. F-70]MBP4138748.1 PorT family protein [Flavobacterium geliluteum]UFH40543.1 PorT family protein [Flavobacterium sp. F-70]
MRLFFSCLFLVSFFNVFSQEETTIAAETKPVVKIDSLYREDQFYFSLIYNSIMKSPGMAQDRFSAGLSLGVLRDMPINKARTFAVATGLGLSYKNYYQNLAITGTKDAPEYNVVSYNDISTNKFYSYLVDVPIEFRWRNSTPESYKFWRIYGGLKLSYVLQSKSVFKGLVDQNVKIVNNKDVNRFQYGAYISTGYNTWNLYACYSLNSLFKSSARTPTEQVDIRTLSMGLIFYIL